MSAAPLPKYIAQPGPALQPRIAAAEARGREMAFDLEAGLPLLEAVQRPLADAGFESAAVSLSGGGFGPFAYVMPSLPVDADHAAFYSAPFAPKGFIELQDAAMTFGTRDGAAFFHCHGLWTEEDMALHGGHILPEASVVAAPIRAKAFAIGGARFEGVQDPETNFKLFEPVEALSSTPAAPADARCFAIRLRPNQDFCGALEDFCRDNGIREARIHGGVGSTIGVHFDDGRVMPRFATELYIMSGTVSARADGALIADISIAVIDHSGETGRGRILRGVNPVLMTMELVLEAIG